jgi:hypothetical protein
MSYGDVRSRMAARNRAKILAALEVFGGWVPTGQIAQAVQLTDVCVLIHMRSMNVDCVKVGHRFMWRLPKNTRGIRRR